jgi:hypothetical protein
MYELSTMVRHAPRGGRRKASTADVLCYGTFQLRCAMDLLERHAQRTAPGDLEVSIQPDLRMVDPAARVGMPATPSALV